jgi:hypothetical protein
MLGFVKPIRFYLIIVLIILSLFFIIFCKFDDESEKYKELYLKTQKALELKIDDYDTLLQKYDSLVKAQESISSKIDDKIDQNLSSLVEVVKKEEVIDTTQYEEIDYSEKINKFIDAGTQLPEDIYLEGKIYAIYKNDYLYTVNIDYDTVFVLKSDYGAYLDTWGIGTMVNATCSKRYSYGFKDCSINLD